MKFNPVVPPAKRHPRCRALADALSSRGITGQAAADAMGLPRSSVARYISGTHVPTLEWLVRLSVAIGCKPSELSPMLADREFTAEEIDKEKEGTK